MMGYFVISLSDDGLNIEGPKTQQELSKSIQPNPWGDTDYGDVEHIKFFDAMPKRWDDLREIEGYYQGLLIIKGDIVVPRPKQVATLFEID
jgi:hypothetical protein